MTDPAIDPSAVVPFRVAVPDADLADLRSRLERTRWPDRETVSDWTQGVPLDRMRSLVDHWLRRYDWRAFEARLNALPQFRTTLDGLAIHFLHVRSRHEGAMPLLLTHGWPGSVVEFLKVIGPLTDPTAHGGTAADAFSLVIPSLPGFGFSDRPTDPGWDVPRIARAGTTLMGRLGYDRWVAQGGDWGGHITAELARQAPAGLLGVHLNYPLVLPEPLPTTGLSAEEARAVAGMEEYNLVDSGYKKQQSTRPQTLGYGLADSPAGQAAWIFEKFWKWTDNTGDPESALAIDEMLDNISIYWFTDTAASSARIYWENEAHKPARTPIDLPVGVSVFPREIFRAPRSWGEQMYRNLIHWRELDRGGHFAAFEQPELFTTEVRDCFRGLRVEG